MAVRIDSVCTSVFVHSPWLEQGKHKNVVLVQFVDFSLQFLK